MKSPFKMTPGRGNMPKTGRGIPPTLMCGSPAKQDGEIELTRKYDEGKKKIAEARSNKENKSYLESKQGINVEAGSGAATAKNYEKKIVDMPDRVRVVGGTGDVVSEAMKNQPKMVEKLKSDYAKAKSYTETARTNNASQYNATSGATKPENLTGKQKETLVKLGKAIKK